MIKNTFVFNCRYLLEIDTLTTQTSKILMRSKRLNFKKTVSKQAILSAYCEVISVLNKNRYLFIYSVGNKSTSIFESCFISFNFRELYPKMFQIMPI